jgi:hypothetical protein
MGLSVIKEILPDACKDASFGTSFAIGTCQRASVITRM